MPITVKDLAEVVHQALVEHIDKFNEENEAMVSVDEPQPAEDMLEIWIDGGHVYGTFVIAVELDTPGDESFVEER